jgi:predicted ATPase/DNA-binding CsgD family transcriptional regulator
VTSFVGRRQELGEIRKQLTAARLVSLVGPGGVGKTRLALRAAGDLGRGFADGAWVVELAEVRDAALVSSALLAALDLRDQAATEPLPILAAYLQDKQLLLLMDNCEHLLEASAEVVTDLLRSAPNLRVIATSREPLQVPGEQVIPVPPLELPREDGAEPLAQLQQNDAITLFSERAAAASGAFELTTSNQAAVVALCRRLDGLPLAIELAAVRTRVLSVGQILNRLGDRFALLTGGARAALPRHQTLRLAIDWSFDLLTDAEQALFSRLCLFAGRFTLDDVAGVCASEDLPVAGVFDLLASLVDKSLVTKEEVGGVACYRLHETIREYAGLKLHDAGEEDALTERWLEHYRTTCLRLADEARYRLVEWLAWAEMEIDNLRAVLSLCLRRGELCRGLDVAASMRYYWITHGTTEAVRWLDQLLTVQNASPPTLVRAYYLRGWLSLLQGDPVAARPWIAHAMATARRTGEVALLSESLSLAVTNENLAGDPEAARGYLDEAEVITADLKDFPANIELVLSRSVHAIFQRDLATAMAASLEGLQLGRAAGDLYHVESMLGNLGMIGLLSGDNDAANSRFVEALQVARDIDNRLWQYYGLAATGWHASTAGRARAAAQLLGAAETLATQTGSDMMGPAVPFLASAKQLARDSLGAVAFDAEYAAGKRMSRDAAVRLALGEPGPSDDSAADAPAASPLAKREVEVARLIAEGMSNKQIGLRLFISEATVASHVRHIMDKLGFNSRSQIAVWMASPALGSKG